MYKRKRQLKLIQKGLVVGVGLSVYQEHTSGGTPNKDTTDALVYPLKSTGLVKSLR